MTSNYKRKPRWKHKPMGPKTAKYREVAVQRIQGQTCGPIELSTADLLLQKNMRNNFSA